MKSAARSAIRTTGAWVFPRGRKAHDGGVDHAEAAEAINAQFLIDHGADRAGAGGVVAGVEAAANQRVRVGEAADFCAVWDEGGGGGQFV